MSDIVDRETRSRMMSAIRGKDTRPELIVRRFLHRKGYRYRLHRRNLPGRPDIVLPKHRVVILVHGCFWHSHDGCFYATSPATRKEFWREKLAGNRDRDLRQQEELNRLGWRVVVIWECGIRHALDDLDSIVPLMKGQAETVEWPSEPVRTR